MEAVRTSETVVSINLTTQHYIPEDYKLHAINFSSCTELDISGQMSIAA
jgi:hypothetical protein